MLLACRQCNIPIELVGITTKQSRERQWLVVTALAGTPGVSIGGTDSGLPEISVDELERV